MPISTFVKSPWTATVDKRKRQPSRALARPSAGFPTISNYRGILSIFKAFRRESPSTFMQQHPAIFVKCASFPLAALRAGRGSPLAPVGAARGSPAAKIVGSFVARHFSLPAGARFGHSATNIARHFGKFHAFLGDGKTPFRLFKSGFRGHVMHSIC
jgi:hypothetical protein